MCFHGLEKKSSMQQKLLFEVAVHFVYMTFSLFDFCLFNAFECFLVRFVD